MLSLHQKMKSIVFFILLMTGSCLVAQPAPQAVKGETTYNFWLSVPENITENKAPLILFLHGKSLSGTDLNRVKRYGILKGLTKNIQELNQSIIVAPQLPSGPWDPHKVNEVMEYVLTHYNVDESRIYVTGMSLGSYGTMKYISTYPDKIAAAVSICGGGEENEVCKASRIPIKLIHGDADRAVKLSESKKVLNAIKKCDSKAPVELEIVKGGTHGSVEDLYRHPALYEWLFKHRKE